MVIWFYYTSKLMWPSKNIRQTLAEDQLCGLDYDVCANLMGGQNCEVAHV